MGPYVSAPNSVQNLSRLTLNIKELQGAGGKHTPSPRYYTSQKKPGMNRIKVNNVVQKLTSFQMKNFNPSGTKGGSKTTPPRFFLCSIC